MSKKHTPGPWEACGDGKCSCKTVGAKHAPVADVIHGEWGDSYPSIKLTDGGRGAKAYLEKIGYGSVPDDVAEANARLIAAAPDLLEACKMALDIISDAEHEQTVLGRKRNSAWLRNAIAKAEGKEE